MGIGFLLLLAAGCLYAQSPAGNLRPAPPPRGAPKNVPRAMPKGGPRLNAPNGEIERLFAMSPEQRERVLEKLPPARQAALRQRFEQFDKRPPEERARLLQMWKKLESLSPEKRELLTHQMQAFNALPDDRRVELRRALNDLSKLSPEEREQRLESEDFKSRFSATELQMLSDLAENYPLQGK
jgi:Protein of unknown function (DUF3106)